MRTTIKDIAKKAEVSANTVSKALNHKPGVSSETRRRIMKIAGGMDYLPNVLAKNLRLNQTKSIGLIMPDNSNPFFARVIKGIQDVAKQAGYHIVLCNTEEDPSFEEEAVNLLLSLRVAGLLITPTQKKIDCILKLKQLGIPFVLVARQFEEVVTHCVATDNVIVGHIATKRLIDQGHERIVFVNGPYENSAAKERFTGYQKALEENRIAFDESLVEWGSLNMEDGYNAMTRVLANQRPPLGAFLMNDYIAIGAMKAVREKNLRIPEDVSIVGCDDIDLAHYLDVPLTTVYQPKYAIGEKGAQILVKIIEGRLSNEEGFQRVLLEPRLVVRKSG